MTNTTLRNKLAKSILTLAVAVMTTASVVAPSTAATPNLFNASAGIYNYCPTSIDYGNNTGIVAYCTNTRSSVVVDSIAVRGITNGQAGAQSIILSPTPGAWDSAHVCDPSIVAGNFTYNGTAYTYLMAYLGCNTLDNQMNQVGFAVSNSPTSGWVKCDAVNPVVRHSYDASQPGFQWGVGQPSLINLDGQGNILLFYTSGTYNETCTYVQQLNVSDINNIVNNGTAKVTNNGTGDFISNGDFAAYGNDLYVACDTHPFAAGVLGNISNTESIYKMSLSSLYDLNGMANGTWELVTRIGGETTGHTKNHNGCFVTNAYGSLTENTTALVTVADELGDFASSLWTYRVAEVDF